MARYFGTNGARGTLDEFPVDIAMKLAYGTGKYFKGGKILVARDGRTTSDLYFHAVSAGLLAAGCTVVDLGLVSSPTAEFMVKKLDADGLIIITASHNPPQYNGMKVVDANGFAVSKERAEEIERIGLAQDPKKWNANGKLSKYDDSVEDHTEAIMKLLDLGKIKGRKLKVVLDCGNGAAATIAPSLFKRLGCEVIPLNSHIDGNFPGRPSEPTEGNVKDLMALVKETKSDCGIAWDGDGDRVIFVDENGKFVIGDKVFAFSVILKLKEKKGPVATTVATSMAIEDLVKAAGGKVVYTKIGAPYLCENMKEAVMGGEEVGGVIWPEISLAKEGMFTAAKMVEALDKKTLSRWIAEIPEYKNIKEKIPANLNKKEQIMKKAKEYAKSNKLDFIDIDGVRINNKDKSGKLVNWVIIRPSGTEDYIRIFAEAKTESEAKELIAKVRKAIGE